MNDNAAALLVKELKSFHKTVNKTTDMRAAPLENIFPDISVELK